MRKLAKRNAVTTRLAAKARQGNLRAQYQLGAIYATGEFGIAVNLAKAAKCYATAAQRGHSEAQYNLGIMYLLGEGVGKNKQKGIEWIRKAANTNCVDAQELLGAIYERGAFGFRSSKRDALKWYRIAAANGNSKAQYELGLMYLNGTGIAKRKGLALIRKAARSGYLEAKTFLQARRARPDSKSPNARRS
jgi:TPR repeat protein